MNQQVYDFIEEIKQKNFTLNLYQTINKDSIISNIQSKINNYNKWKQYNVREMNEWLNKKLKIKDEF